MQTAGLGLCRNRHGNQFHTRIHIPKDLAPLLGRAEVRLSLGTEVRRYAIAAARLVHSRKITAFDEMRAVMDKNNFNPTPEQQQEARQRLLQVIQQRRTTQPALDADKAADARYAHESDEQSHREAQLVALDELADCVRLSEFEHAERLYEIMGSAVPSRDAFKFTTAQRNSTVAEVAELRAGLADAECKVRANEHELARTKDMLQDALKRGVTQSEELPEVRISELLDEYQRAPSTEGKDGRKQYPGEVKAFIRSMGDMFIKDIDAPVMRQFFDKERMLPGNLTKRINANPGRSIEAVIEMAWQDGAKLVEPKTALQRVERIKTLFNWALKYSGRPKKWGFIDGINPAAGFSIGQMNGSERKKTDNSKSTRRAFSDEDLRRLFAGQKSEGREGKQIVYGYGAKRFKKRCQYWLPLLALFTGARANQLAQLRVSDVGQDDEGVWHFSFNEGADSDGVERKRLKNTPSERLVPIHSKLIQLGFIDYLQALKSAKHWCLFQELDPQDATAARPVWNSIMTGWWPRYQEACDVLDDDKGKATFHCFRHATASRLMNAKLLEYIFNGILGHEQKTESTKTYGELSIGVIRAEMEKMKFPADVMEALPAWQEVEFTEPQPQPVALGLPAAPAKRGRVLKKSAA